MPRPRCLCWLTLLGLLVTGVPARSCPVCITFPRKSAADYLIESSRVVFARENPDRKFSFAVVELLKGTLPGEPIDLLVDSSTRRTLTAHPERVAVLAQDGKTMNWRPLGLADPEYADIVRQVLRLAPRWQTPHGRQHRIEFFVPLFGHDDPQIYRLAYLELSRAPYAVIKQLGLAVSREQTERVLSNPRYLEWRQLAILLKAHSGRAGDRQSIRDLFHTAERLSMTRDLAALTTAYVEFDAETAVAFIEDRYFDNPRRTDQELVEVTKALSLHGTEGRTDLRDRIVAAYATLLRNRPTLAHRAAADLFAWKRRELVKPLRRIAASDVALAKDKREVLLRYLAWSSSANDE